MNRTKLFSPIVAITCLLISCGSPQQIPPIDKFPQSWLKAWQGISDIERQRDQLQKTSQEFRNQFDTFLAKALPGDEIWSWECPNHSDFYPFGVCILRNGKIVELFKIGVVGWMN